MDSITSKTAVPDVISRRMGVTVQQSGYQLSDSDLEALFDLAKKLDSPNKKENPIESQARIYKALRQYPSEDSEYILEGALSALRGKGIDRNTTSIMLRNREPVRLLESLWLCESYDLPNCIREKVDKSWNGLYLLDTRLIDPDDRFNSDGVVRIFSKQELKISELKDNQISPQSRFEIGDKTLTLTNSSSRVIISEKVNIPVVAVPKPVEKSSMEKLGLSLSDLFNSLKSQLQNPNVLSEKIIEEFKKTETLLVKNLGVKQEDFRTELQNTMNDFVNSNETSPKCLIDRKDFFSAQGLDIHYSDAISNRVINDMNTSGSVSQDGVLLVKHFNLSVKNPIYKNYVFDKVKNDFEFDLKNDLNTEVNLIAKFILANHQEASDAGAEKGEFGKLIISTLIHVANSEGISSICLKKCRELGERYQVADEIPKAISIPEPVSFVETLPEITPSQDTDRLSLNMPESITHSPEPVVKNEEVAEPVKLGSKFDFKYEEVNGVFTSKDLASGICAVMQDELIAVLDGKGDKRVVPLIDAISMGKPLEICVSEAKFISDKEARTVLRSFLSKNNIDPDLEKALMVSSRKSNNGNIRRQEIRCPKEKLFELVNEDGSFNSHGHVTSIRSEIEGIRVQYDESGKPMMVFDHDIPDHVRHQTSLAKAVELILDGELVLIGPPNKVKTGGLYVENKANINDKNGKPIALVCIHGQTNSRVWGSYYASTGELVFKDIAKDHSREWNDIIQEHQREARSQRG